MQQLLIALLLISHRNSFAFFLPRGKRQGYCFLLLMFALGLLPSNTFSQNMVCDPFNPTPGKDCTTTCIVCDLDNLEGTIASDDANFVEIACLQGTGHTFGFIAMSTQLTIEVEVVDCQNGQGEENSIEVTAYRDINNSCFDGQFGLQGEAIFPCNLPGNSGDVIHRVLLGEKKKFSNIEDLIEGQIYYIEFTTKSGVTCDYEVKVLEGNTKIPEVKIPELLENISPCIGKTQRLILKDSIPLTSYIFTLNGDTVSVGPASVDISYNRVGGYELCVSGTNVCSRSPVRCYNYQVVNSKPSEQRVYRCPGECLTIGQDSMVCMAGNYQLTLMDFNGCDSVILYEVVDRLADTTQLNITFCGGDSLQFAGQTINTPGIYSFSSRNQFGCDSLISLRTDTTTCPVLGKLTTGDPLCAGAQNGWLSFSLFSGVPPFTYSVRPIAGEVISRGTIDYFGENIRVEGLGAATYSIFVKDKIGSVGYLNQTLSDPSPLYLSSDIYDPTCAMGNDGRVSLVASGGTEPYRYDWSDQVSTSVRDDLSTGNYSVNLTDANGCALMRDITISDPPEFTVNFVVEDEDCLEPNSGSFQLQNKHDSFIYELWRGEQIVPQDSFFRLSADEYTLLASNEVGCNYRDTFTIIAPESPRYTLMDENLAIKLGEAVRLDLSGENLANLSWRNADTFVCEANCFVLDVSPLHTTTYVAEITATSGCRATEEITVTVDRRRKFYIPSAFSPNGDRVNDRLHLFSGGEIESVIDLCIYDRWGNEVYRASSTNPNETKWDGTIDGHPGQTGVYIWRAIVRFRDGETLPFKGSTNLIR